MYIELRNISKHFTDGANQTRQVLQDLNLSLDKGDFVAITGVSGSGKSTLLNILGTLLRPDGGSYHLDGLDVTLPGVSLEDVRNQQVGMVFQDFRLLPQFNALQNILLPTLARKRAATKEDTDYALQLMQLVGIETLKDQLPATLSGGEKARVALCRALIMRPALLLADEPTGQLDADHAAQIAQLLQEVCDKLSTTIVLVTHDPLIAAKAQKTLRLEHGRLQ